MFYFTGWGRAWWHWMIMGALYGVMLRVLIALPLKDIANVAIEALSIAFLVVTPFVVGALTIYGFRGKKCTIPTMLFAPWATVALMALGCAVVMLEGSICIAIMAPLLLLCASLGGLAMGLALRFKARNQGQLKAVALLPLLMMLGEGQVPLGNREIELRQSVQVNAAPSTVWKQILTAKAIEPNELPFSITHLIGVPKPLEGLNLVGADGQEVRYSTWEKGVNFQAVVTERKENRFISWKYVFNENSFPQGSMDEHVAIGGKYFDLHDTTFNLHELPGGKTQLEIVAHYRITSAVNFYAVPAANFLGQDFINTILGLYKGRSERAEAALPVAASLSTR